MGATNYLEQKVLEHHCKVASWSQATHLYVGLHVCSTLAANASAGAGSISVNHAVVAGAKLVIGAGTVNAETLYAGTVTGSGPYTVPLLASAGGSAATLANAHTSGEKVQYEPADDASNLNEPSSGSYARVQCDSWNAAADEAGTSNKYCSNNGAISFAAFTADIGRITHFFIADASSGGNKTFIGELDANVEGVNGLTLTFTNGSLKLKAT